MNGVGNEERRKDCFELLKLFKQLTRETPKMLGASIVGFGNYHYKHETGREGDWFLTGFSPRKQNLSIYITAGFSRYGDIMENLGKYKTGASCLYVKKLSDIDIDKLKTLVENSVAYMKKRYE
ncbi:MAG: DUF1801 domain-containing protein [Chitinophagaceae bacterium]